MAEDFNNFDFDDDEGEKGAAKWLPLAGAAVLVCLLGGGAYFLIQKMSGTTAPIQPTIQQISIVQPPPPPPPPEIEEPPPEPELEEIIEEPEPEPLADESSDADEPLGEDLGLDADGVAGSDAFGLTAKKGGRGLIGGGDPNAWYGAIVAKDLENVLIRDEVLRSGRYSVTLKIWLSEDGTVKDVEMLSVTDDAELNRALERLLGSGVRISRKPPDDLPQPIRVRVTSRT